MVKFIPWFMWQVPFDWYVKRGYERITVKA